MNISRWPLRAILLMLSLCLPAAAQDDFPVPNAQEISQMQAMQEQIDRARQQLDAAWQAAFEADPLLAFAYEQDAARVQLFDEVTQEHLRVRGYVYSRADEEGGDLRQQFMQLRSLRQEQALVELADADPRNIEILGTIVLMMMEERGAAPEDWQGIDMTRPAGEVGAALVELTRQRQPEIEQQIAELSEATGFPEEVHEQMIVEGRVDAMFFLYETYVRAFKPQAVKDAEQNLRSMQIELSRMFPEWRHRQALEASEQRAE